jgi:hypothetical protein
MREVCKIGCEGRKGCGPDQAKNDGQFLMHPIIVFEPIEQLEQWLNSFNRTQLSQRTPGMQRSPDC